MAVKEFPNPTLSLTSSKIAGHHEATTIGNAYWDRGYDSIVTVNQLIENRREAAWDRQNAATPGKYAEPKRVSTTR